MSVSLGILFALIAGISIAFMAIFVRIVTKMGGDSFTAVLVSLFLNVVRFCIPLLGWMIKDIALGISCTEFLAERCLN